MHRDMAARHGNVRQHQILIGAATDARLGQDQLVLSPAIGTADHVEDRRLAHPVEFITCYKPLAMSHDYPQGSPLPPPSKIIGVGRNYQEHAKELGNTVPEEPLLFLKPPTAIIASGAPIVRPRGWDRVDFEGELGVVIGQRCHRVTRETALDYIGGYTIVNDVTVRDLQKKDGQWTRAKGFDTFCPVGPRLVKQLDHSALRIVTRVDGVVKQDAPVSDMIFDIATIIVAASRVMTLLPGDLIATGTPPGVGPIVPGNVVEIEIAGIGILSNPVIEEN
jgi:2-keto-4-pentenoate hydratase/2-oxohepta-3-ene-1,7-dioic acid hydratase in catechol pathway